jgi:hypothetical protein
LITNPFGLFAAAVVVLFLGSQEATWIFGLLRKERLALMGKVNAVDAALRLLSGGGNAPPEKVRSPMFEMTDSVGVQQ